MSRNLVRIAFIYCLAACAPLRLTRAPRVVEPNRLAAAIPTPHCVSLSNKTLAWNVTGIVAGGIGSGAATGAGSVTNTPAHYTLIGAAGVFSLLGGVSAYLGGWYAARFTKECP